MNKTLAAFTIIATSAFASLTFAKDTSAASFQTAIKFDTSVTLEDAYESASKQARVACKHQIRSVKALYTRVNYLRTCSAELMDSMVIQIANNNLTAFHAAKQGKSTTQKFAQAER